MEISKGNKAILWSGIEKCSSYIVNFTIQIILARLLIPDDYAIIALLGIFYAISQAFIDSGFVTTLIQKKVCTQKDYSSVFFFNIGMGIVFYILFYLFAGVIENFFHYDNFTNVIRVYSLNLVLLSVGMVHRVILMKNLEFKKIAYISIIAAILSGVPAIVMAYHGWGYWALVLQILLNSLFTSILTIVYSKWKPSFTFSTASLLEMAPFGLRVMVVAQFHAIYNNIYSLLIGKRFSAIELGLYDRGKTLASMGPVGFSDFYMRALYPIQANMQDDREGIVKSYNDSFSIICKSIVAFSVFVAVFSKPLIFTLFGEKWIECAPMLQVIAIGYLFYPLQSLNINILKVHGESRFLLWSEVIKKTLGICTVLVLISFSLKVVLWGWTICAILEFIISEFFYLKIYSNFKTPFSYLFQTIITTSILACSLLFLLNLLTDNPYWICGAGTVLFGGVVIALYGKSLLNAIVK